MSLGWPEALWFTPLLLVIYLGWRWREKNRPGITYSDIRFLHATPSRRLWLARWVPLLGRLLAGVLLLLALVNPRWPVPGSRIAGEGLALMLVLDVSGSMAEQDIVLEGKPVTRLQAATAVLKKFLAGTDQHPRGNDAIGLVTFAARPIDVCPPTTSHASVEYFLNQAEPLGTIPDNTTNIGDALALAVSLLQRSTLPGTKSIILLSDGEHTIPPELDPDALEPRQAAQLAAALGVRIHTIFLGGEPGDDIGQKQEQERALATLRAVAELTQGQANRASDADSLTRIHEQLESLEKARIDTYIYTEYQDFRFWLGLGSLLVLLLTIFLQETWLRIIP